MLVGRWILSMTSSPIVDDVTRECLAAIPGAPAPQLVRPSVVCQP